MRIIHAVCHEGIQQINVDLRITKGYDSPAELSETLLFIVGIFMSRKKESSTKTNLDYWRNRGGQSCITS